MTAPHGISAICIEIVGKNRNWKMLTSFFWIHLYFYLYLDVKALAKWQEWCIISLSLLLPFAPGLVEDKSLGYCSLRPHESDNPPWWEIKGFLMGWAAGTYCIVNTMATLHILICASSSASQTLQLWMQQVVSARLSGKGMDTFE